MPQQERRERVRTSRSGTQDVVLRYFSRPNFEQTVAAKLIDYSDSGCGIRAAVELEAGTLVTIAGDFESSGQEATREGQIIWCKRMTVRGNLLGISFSRKAKAKEQAEHHKAPPSAGFDRKGADGEERPDYYELLQLSPNADTDTLHRVYRALAQRFHPDNQDTGNQEMFRRLLEAYQVLSDPERRARYDVDYRAMKKLQWRIFDQPSAAGGVQGEQAKRRGVLALLYTKRRNMPHKAGMSLFEIEEVLGVPRDHLEFALWFLREAGQISRSDNQQFAITLKGAEEAEKIGAFGPPSERLIESPEVMARRASLG